jgi:endonuclease-3 related protein
LLLNAVYRAKEMSTHTVFPSTRQSVVHSPSGRALHSQYSYEQNSFPILNQYFDVLLYTLGPQHWWPGRTRFEIIIGAILTQNTNWANVERAISALRLEGLLTPARIRRIPVAKLGTLIRSSGYFRQKARRLKEFVVFLSTRHDGSLTKMFRTPTSILREELLAVHGIGPETADSILLYAGRHSVFVVDAYARRILERHGLANEKNRYAEIQGLFQKSLPADSAIYNEFHALIVYIGKHLCRPSSPVCSACPLSCFLTRPIEGSR